MPYTSEKQAQIVIALLKAHGISRIIASPGATNVTFVGSIQDDPDFKVYSAVDERSAAYMATGMAAETGEPVVLSCTGATASRNYMPGLTEAYYRKLPVLAVTSTQIRARIGHHIPQVIDRSSPPKDLLKLSVDLPVVKDGDDVWECEMKVNRAILELKRHGGGPAHINLPTTYSRDYNVRDLPSYRKISRWTHSDSDLPNLMGRVAVFVGSHKLCTEKEAAALDRFCEVNDAVVFCDHTSGYYGKYRVTGALLGGQEGLDRSNLKPDITIHLGEVSGDYQSEELIGKEIWRVSPDGEIRDTFRKLRHVFEVSEEYFFDMYAHGAPRKMAYFKACKAQLETTRAKIPDLPLSNLWLASQLAHRLPSDSVVHFAILNSLRSWNFFELPKGVRSASNVGGFGIDGCTSSLIGAALANPDRPYFLVTGDLAFFYDLNALGNRHLGQNIRILLVNNGNGTEFTQYGHAGSDFGLSANRFIAAGGHFGRQSKALVRNYAENLGFEYIAISDKSDIVAASARFLMPEPRERPILIEAFVNSEDESDALRTIKSLDASRKSDAKNLAKTMLGPQRILAIKRVLGK